MITKKTCEIWDKAQSAWYEIWETLNDISEKISDAASLKNSIKYGLINLGDIASAEVLATIKNMSSRIADSLLEQASEVAYQAISALLQPLLRILLFAPNAIFTMIEIPHKRALESTIKERIELDKAMSSLDVVMYVMQKWLGDNNYPGYRRQMELSLPLIKACLKLIGELIDGLSDPANSYFDEVKFSDLQKTLSSAIESTETSSNLEKKLKIEAQQKAAADTLFNQKMEIINKKYRERKDEINAWYKSEMIKANKSESNASAAVNEMIINEQYSYRMKALDFEYSAQKKSARVQSESEAIIQKEVYSTAVKDFQNDFKNDLLLLSNSLAEMYESFKNAFKFYEVSYQCCQTIINSESYLRQMISWIISILKITGNESADVLVRALEGAEGSIAVADNVLEKAISKKTSFSKSDDLTALISANSMLKTADANIEASVVQELIDIINSDENLGANDARFQEFIHILNSVPDWKIKELSWLSDEGSIAPYPDLITKSTILLSKLPKKITANDSSIQGDVSEVRNITITLRNHSLMVSRALSNFTPYNTPEGKQLRQLLSRMQLLDEFSIGFNIADTLYKLIEGVSNDGWQIPTPSNCKAAFPDEIEITEENVKGTMLNEINAATYADIVMINPDNAKDKDYLPDKANIDFKSPLDNFVSISPEGEDRYS